MEILFVIDSIENLDHKLGLLEPLGANVRFFVKSDLVASLIKKKDIVKNIIAIYNHNVNITIDKYLRKEDYVPKDTLLYYSSAELTAEMIGNIRDHLVLKPDTIHVKKKLNWWARLKLWFYNKVVKILFGYTDAYASTKLQYFSARLMEAYRETSFKNHIFEIPNTMTIALEKGNEQSYYTKTKFNKNYLLNPIVFCFILICYVVMEKFFNLPFWVYLLAVLLLITVIINLFIMIIKDVLDTRYKK